MPVVAVARPPTGIDGKLRQVSEPMSDQVWIDSGRGAAHQSAKRIEICRSRSLGDQVRVEELVMSDLIIGVVMDVLIHVFVQHREAPRYRLDCQLPPGTSSSWMPPSSLYWIQKSASSSSSAAGKRSSAASPGERPPLASAVRMLPNSPAPMVPAPRAIVLPRKERRLMDRFRGLFLFSKLSSRGRLSLLLEPFAVGLVVAFMPVESQPFMPGAGLQK